MSFKISGYTTTRNAQEMMYPFKESISSMMGFCEEICVLDSSDKSDGTWENLLELQKQFPGKLKIHHETSIDWSAANHGIFDGRTKQMAREMCNKSQYLYQFDIDEICHEDHAPLVRPLIENISGELQKIPLLALPVIEYWGKYKVRIDVNPWKWRISLNIKDLVHGIPAELRYTDPLTNLEYAKPGTDSCDYISRATGERYKCISFIPPEIDQARIAAIHSNNLNDPNLKTFETWFNSAIFQLPGVYHYSWFNIERKINQYKLFWSSFWKAMYNLDRDEKTNPFFPGKLWNEVTDKEIKQYAFMLETQTGGHIFHNSWNGAFTNSIRILKDHPRIMNSWIEKYK